VSCWLWGKDLGFDLEGGREWGLDEGGNGGLVHEIVDWEVC
jgi:hypothetical protein